MADNRLLIHLVSPQQAELATYTYDIYFLASDIYRRTRAVMRQRPIGLIKSSNTATVWVKSDVYTSPKIYTHQ